ncbi:Caffeic acid O-methyltransferase [Melia azedarach]|uniref:Caffeic acid O-methyltransferase n=1 Tax=Melia azedarach TaxID=155640 RepID=A0ACC1YY90_MELAZ|nr:Caffeic acid O-methyltransferase [Melia azedarach]
MASSVKLSDQQEQEESFAYAIQLVMGSVLPMAMQSAIELGIFDIIAKAGPGAKLSASEIAAQTSSRNKEAPLMLERILRLLATHTILECSADGRQSQRLYSLAPVSKYFVRNEDGRRLHLYLLFVSN